MKHIQNNQKSIRKSKPAVDFKNLKKKIQEPKVSRLKQMFVIYKKKTIPSSMDLKIYRKSIARPMNFYF